jgi:hypothetical protein
VEDASLADALVRRSRGKKSLGPESVAVGEVRLKRVMPVSLAALLLAIGACAGLETWLEKRALDARGAPVPFASIARETSSGVGEVREIVVDSEPDWQALWN